MEAKEVGTELQLLWKPMASQPASFANAKKKVAEMLKPRQS
jgi:hypothetical protein